MHPCQPHPRIDFDSSTVVYGCLDFVLHVSPSPHYGHGFWLVLEYGV